MSLIYYSLFSQVPLIYSCENGIGQDLYPAQSIHPIGGQYHET